MTYPPRVFTTVLNYRNADDTLRCMASLARSAYRRQFPVIIDNGSDAETVRRLRSGLATRTLILSEENLGYAAGNNLGITHALERGADMIWILNPDTEVHPHTLKRLVSTMSQIPDIGVLGCRILNGNDGGKTIWFNGATIDWSTGGGTSHVDNGRKDADVLDERVRSVDYVTGASMLVRREVFEHIGLLPERYFLYFEETDFNVRARTAGGRVMIDSGARLLHYRRSWERAPGPNYVFYFVRNRLLFGRTFSDVPLEVIERDLDKPIAAWRSKVAKVDAGWVPAYDRLVAKALADGRAGQDGRDELLVDATWERLARG
jgi:GT2 family glycosyltransferase